MHTLPQLFLEIIWRKSLAQLDIPKKTRHLKLIILGTVTLLIIIGIISSFIAYMSYKDNLKPFNPKDKTEHRVIVKEGETSKQIAEKLKKQGLIKSSDAFLLYMKFEKPKSVLKTGCYSLLPSQSVEKIVYELDAGKTGACMVTIIPGRTLDELTSDLSAYEYSKESIKKALKETYDSPLLADKPKDASLEGYIYPETFDMQADTDPHNLFQRSMDTLYEKLKEDNLIEAFKAHGLTIYQAITLASIIQKEASDPNEQPQIAQVFLTRLEKEMKLESDVTFHYAAKILGVQPSLSLDSPYNTRIYLGLPPGPISNMNYSALKAVAYPAEGDYLFFIAGDDGKIHYGRTVEEHQKNISNYCHELCGKDY